MPINFPKLHIAESVTNRILNVWDDLEASAQAAAAPMPTAAPSTPQAVEMQGAQLDAALSAPPAGELATPDEMLPPTAGSIASGESPIEGML
jgi:hypothetical protein